MAENRIAANPPDTEDSADGTLGTAETLARQYREPLKRFFKRRLGDPTAAEDLAQEVLLKLARQRSMVNRTRPAYIFLAARSVLLDQVRRNRVRERLGIFDADRYEVDAPSAERVYSAQERVQRVSRLMTKLSPRVREVFMMHRLEGLSYSEIARALNITMSTVEKHMSTALRLLMQHADEIE